MIWIGYLFLLLISLAGVILALFMLPGLWLMLGSAAIFALGTHGRLIGAKTLLTLFFLALLSEILELTLGGAAAKAVGGGKRAMIGGLIGGIVGGIFLSFLIPIPILGTIVGICLGSFLGAAGFEMLGGREWQSALRIGVGAAGGRFAGIVTKLVLGIMMLLLIVVIAFP